MWGGPSFGHGGNCPSAKMGADPACHTPARVASREAGLSLGLGTGLCLGLGLGLIFSPTLLLLQALVIMDTQEPLSLRLPRTEPRALTVHSGGIGWTWPAGLPLVPVSQPARRESGAEPWALGAGLWLCPGRASSVTLVAGETGHAKAARLPPPCSLLGAQCWLRVSSAFFLAALLPVEAGKGARTGSQLSLPSKGGNTTHTHTHVCLPHSLHLKTQNQRLSPVPSHQGWLASETSLHRSTPSPKPGPGLHPFRPLVLTRLFGGLPVSLQAPPIHFLPRGHRELYWRAALHVDSRLPTPAPLPAAPGLCPSLGRRNSDREPPISGSQ